MLISTPGTLHMVSWILAGLTNWIWQDKEISELQPELLLKVENSIEFEHYMLAVATRT